MRKTGRCIAAALVAVLLLLPAVNGRAEVFFSKPPESWQEKPLLQWTVLDVDEGDAMLLECGGESMLVDGGPDPFREMLRDALDAKGFRRGMKYILNTHAHDDHIDGIIRLFEYGFRPGEYLHSYSDSAVEADGFQRRAVENAKKNGVSVRRIGDSSFLWLGDAEIRIYQCTEYADTNARSLMLKVTYGQCNLLLCADITGKTQLYFAENLPEGLLDVDVIKVPHHGITPVNMEFMDAASPEAAVITNTQKRLDGKTANQLRDRQIPALYSGDGTVYALCDGVDWYIWQEDGKEAGGEY
ncbi:MAG: MBL fold metallo-hydrolase [Clostridiales bacterium]|nr:MBL fold metallo-hydrolase [Clostridiales bacterium]